MALNTNRDYIIIVIVLVNLGASNKNSHEKYNTTPSYSTRCSLLFLLFYFGMLMSLKMKIKCSLERAAAAYKNRTAPNARISERKDPRARARDNFIYIIYRRCIHSQNFFNVRPRKYNVRIKVSNKMIKEQSLRP